MRQQSSAVYASTLIPFFPLWNTFRQNHCKRSNLCQCHFDKCTKFERKQQRRSAGRGVRRGADWHKTLQRNGWTRDGLIDIKAVGVAVFLNWTMVGHQTKARLLTVVVCYWSPTWKTYELSVQTANATREESCSGKNWRESVSVTYRSFVWSLAQGDAIRRVIPVRFRLGWRQVVVGFRRFRLAADVVHLEMTSRRVSAWHDAQARWGRG